jgi:hypothetical protein
LLGSPILVRTGRGVCADLMMQFIFRVVRVGKVCLHSDDPHPRAPFGVRAPR